MALAAAREELNAELPLFHQILNGTDVKHAVIACFEEFLLADHVSGQRLYYIRELSRQLKQLPPDSLPEAVDGVLLYMNFNSDQYLAYKQKQLSENIRSFQTYQEQLSQTQLLLKMNEQQRENGELRYSHHHPSLKDHIRKWLWHEMDYLENRSNDPEDHLLSGELNHNNTKIRTTLSIGELGFFLYLMIEKGPIQNNKKSVVAAHYARMYATNSKEMISADSLRKKMYSVNSSSVSKIQALFLDLYNECRLISGTL